MLSDTTHIASTDKMASSRVIGYVLNSRPEIEQESIEWPEVAWRTSISTQFEEAVEKLFNDQTVPLALSNASYRRFLSDAYKATEMFHLSGYVGTQFIKSGEQGTHSTIRERWSVILSTRLAQATERREIIDLLDSTGLKSVTQRLRYLNTLAEDDPDEMPIVFESLRRLASFMLSQRELPTPQIGVNADGMAQVEWVTDYGILAMEFLDFDMIRFAAMLDPSGPRIKHGVQPTINGVLPTTDTLDAVRIFTGRLMSQ